MHACMHTYIHTCPYAFKAELIFHLGWPNFLFLQAWDKHPILVTWLVAYLVGQNISENTNVSATTWRMHQPYRLIWFGIFTQESNIRNQCCRPSQNNRTLQRHQYVDFLVMLFLSGKKAMPTHHCRAKAQPWLYRWPYPDASSRFRCWSGSWFSQAAPWPI